MTEEILFADMLNHYSLKTVEISDILNDMTGHLNKCVAISRDSWQSQAAEKFILQISNVQQYIRKADESIDELIRIFDAIKNNELDSQLEGLEAEINAYQNN